MKNSTQYQAIIFDFFGVIHDDPMKLWYAATGATNHSAFAGTARQLDVGAISYATFLSQLSQHSGQGINAITAEFEKATVNTSVVQIIGSLRHHAKIGLLSNACTEELEPLLHKHRLRPLFDTLTISSQVQLAKPDAAIFEHALRQLGVLPHHAIFIDDNHENIRAAKQLGIKTIHFSDHQQLKNELNRLLLPAQLVKERV